MSLRISDLRQRLRAAGALPCHEERVLRSWLCNQPLTTTMRRQTAESFFPQGVRALLPQLSEELAALACIQSAHPGTDGSERLLVGLADGQTVESVLLPRDGLCISSQLGCAVGCAFCMTGQGGLLRQLSSGEILAQVVLASARRPVKKVVFMGMGEPAHNLDNVLEAIDALGRLNTIGHKNLVFSTVGDRRVFERLPQGEIKPALALSLHTTRADLREKLLPRAPQIAPQELVELAENYARQISYPIQYQWTLLDGVNDGDEEIEALIKLMRGKFGIVNLILYNSVPELPFTRPDNEKAAALVRRLNRAGILCRLRNSAGQEVDGGCGQLRARVFLKS